MSEPFPDDGTSVNFQQLALSEPVMRALSDVGYESPSPIQAATIPHLLAGRDLVGTAQTGTGKTAAFALPILSRIDVSRPIVQALVLAPTRELAIQVAEAFQKYAAHIRGFHVMPIYGGQSYGPQLHALKRGVHVVVGTPGRVIDHLEKGTLDISQLQCLVLDEADEMLRMGFIDDVENVIKRTPAGRQVALFSATMPAPIRRIAGTYLKNPAEVTIRGKTSTAVNTRQRYWLVSGVQKLDALTRILEAETFDGMIIFSRTKISTDELAAKLEARGFSAAAINGDIPQALREKTIQRLKDGHLDILVATDVAARGLDVDRVSHVVNYDIPYDTEAYVHRIGRTGRAGRSGDAILFVTPRERGMLRAIERATRQPIEPMALPTIDDVNTHRIGKFKQQITDALAKSDLGIYRNLIEQYETEHDVPAVEIAAALARIAQRDTPLLLETPKRPERGEWERRAEARGDRPAHELRSDRPAQDSRFQGERTEPVRARPEFAPRPDRVERSESRPVRERVAESIEPEVARVSRERVDSSPPGSSENIPANDISARGDARPERSKRSARGDEPGMERFRIEVGHSHNVQPGNIVGAIANEAELDSKHIGRIEIFDEFSLVDLPEGMPDDLMEHLQNVWVGGQRLRISRATDADSSAVPLPRSKPGFNDKPRGGFKPGFRSDKPKRPRF
ncbi:MAG: DEAD/DEAH box helicase [Pseudomonadota bacterium]|nr:DEAD/DEAH box helicase [Pseudomonadota bacterium]